MMLQRFEQRDSRRFKLDAQRVKIEKPSSLSGIMFEDISASGIKMFFPGPFPSKLPRSPVALKLGSSVRMKTRLLPVRIVSNETQTTIGAKFKHVDRKNMGKLSLFLAACFLDADRTLDVPQLEPSDRIPILVKKHKTLKRDLLRYYCIIQGYPLEIQPKGQVFRKKIKLSDILRDDDRYFIVAIPENNNTIDLQAGQTCVCTFPGENAVHFFETDIKRIESGKIIFEMPAMIVQSGFRSSLRSRTNADQQVSVVIHHPRLPTEKLKKPLWDLGAIGFSFPLAPETNMLFPGELISQCTIQLPESPVRIAGVIRSIRRYPDQWVYGVEIVRFFNDDERNRWMSFVLQSTHERLKTAGRKDGFNFWRVLEASEYIRKEVTPAIVPHIKKCFSRHWRLHSVNYQVNSHILLHKRNKPIAAASVNLLYPNTSLSHHVSVDRRYLKSFFDIGRELICGLQYITRHMIPTKYYISYFYADKTYNNIMFRQFINRYPSQEDYVYDRYQLYKCLTASAPKNVLSSKDDPVIEDANPQLLEFLSRHQRATLPSIEFEAFAYDEDQIDLEAFSRRCLSMGYERKRRIFFAIKNQLPQAALVAESGDEGVNAFNLANCCWVVNLRSEAEQEHLIVERLLTKAIEFYCQENKSEFIWFRKRTGEPDTSLEKLGIIYLTDGMRWIGNNKILSVYLHYVRETLGMLREHLRPY